MADVDIFHKSLNFEKDIVFFQWEPNRFVCPTLRWKWFRQMECDEIQCHQWNRSRNKRSPQISPRSQTTQSTQHRSQDQANPSQYTYRRKAARSFLFSSHISNIGVGNDLIPSSDTINDPRQQDDNQCIRITKELIFGWYQKRQSKNDPTQKGSNLRENQDFFPSEAITQTTKKRTSKKLKNTVHRQNQAIKESSTIVWFHDIRQDGQQNRKAQGINDGKQIDREELLLKHHSWPVKKSIRWCRFPKKTVWCKSLTQLFNFTSISLHLFYLIRTKNWLRQRKRIFSSLTFISKILI